MARVQGLRPGQQQRHVVGGAVREQGLQHVVAGALQRGSRSGQRLEQVVDPLVDVASARLDETVGVEREQAAFGQLDLGRLERQTTQPQWRPGGKVEQKGFAAGDEQRRLPDGPRVPCSSVG